MKEKTRQKYLLLAAGLATSVPIQTRALEAMDVLLFNKGPVSLRPQFDVVETFNDNVFYGDDVRVKREYDFLTGVSPGFDLRIGQNPANSLKLTYSYDEFVYALHPNLDAGQHHGGLSSYFEFHRFTIVGRDLVDLLSSVLGSGVNISGKVTRLVNYHDYNIQYTLSEKTAVYVEGLFSAVDFKSGFQTELLDSNTLIGTAGFSFLALPKASLFGEVYYGQTATSPNLTSAKPPHAEFVGGFLGAKGDFTPHLTGRVKAGYEVRQFSDHSPAGKSPVVNLSLEQRFTEKTTLALNYSRRQEVSVQFSRASYVVDSADVTFQQVLGSSARLRASLQAAYDLVNYDENSGSPKRRDNNLRAGASLNYQIRRWAVAGLAYNFEHFSSDLPIIIDYDVNRVTLSLAIGF